MANSKLTAQKEALKSAMLAYLKEKDVAPEWVHFKFENSFGSGGDSDRGIEYLNGLKGMRVSMSDSEPAHSGAIMRAMLDFNDNGPLEGLKTFKAYRTSMGALTWEDVAAGMNAQFERLGSSARVDMSAFRTK